MKSCRCYSRHVHDSRMEADYCNWLLARQQAGEIKAFCVWSPISLEWDGKHWKDWKVDFQVIENDGSISYHECKGFNRSDDNFKLKLSLAMTQYPDTKFYVNKKICSFTPMNRIRCEGIITRKKPKQNKRYVKTYCRKTKRFITVSVDELQKKKGRK